MLGEPENHFSLVRAALSTGRRAKRKSHPSIAFLMWVLFACYPVIGSDIPGPALDSGEARVIDGLKVTVAPGKPWFDPEDEVYIRVGVQNTADAKRYLWIAPPAGPTTFDDAQKSTVLELNGQRKEVEGLPCYIHLAADLRWDVRLNENGYSDHYQTPVEMDSGDELSFRIGIPPFGDNRKRPTGKLFIFSRFAVSTASAGPPTPMNGPESSMLIIDRGKLTNAVEVLKKGLGTPPKYAYEIESAVRAIADNPLPEHAPLILSAINYEWPFRSQIQWTLWFAASQYVDPSIYKAAVEKAEDPGFGAGYAELVYRTIYRNIKFLSRKDAHAIVANPQLDQADFVGVKDKEYNNGFYPTVLFAMVAEAQDIPKLVDLCARFIPVRIGHDIQHAGLWDRRLVPIRDAFLRYPGPAKEALRVYLRLGTDPSKSPWAGEFSLGNVPVTLSLFAQWLSELKDTESIPILEVYARKPLVPVSNWMMRNAPALIARIDGTEAMKALRRLDTAATEERAKLGDPAAVDSLLARSRGLYGSRFDDTGQTFRLLAVVFSILEPSVKPASGTLPERAMVEATWQIRRPEYVKRFVEKYGFDPDTPAGESQNTR